MAQRKIYRHGQVAERIEQGSIQVENDKGFFVEHSAPKCRNLPDKFHLDEEPVKAQSRNAQDEHDHDDELHRMLVEIIVHLAVGELSADDSADEQGKKNDGEKQGHR